MPIANQSVSYHHHHQISWRQDEDALGSQVDTIERVRTLYTKSQIPTVLYRQISIVGVEKAVQYIDTTDDSTRQD